jgi:hypothetical protein
MIVRVVIVTAVILLMSWGRTASLGAVEAVRLPMSCSYVANKVTLARSPSDQLYVIIDDREHKTIRGCSPGLTGKCRDWEVHRFDLLCGGRRVSWRLVAGQLLNPASAPEKREALFRPHLKPWELRTLLAEPEFAPVDELGGRILLLADNSMPQRPTGQGAENAKVVVATEIASQPPGPPKFEQDTGSPQIEPAKAVAAVPLTSTESKAAAARTNIAASGPPAGNGDDKPADVVTLAQFDGSKRGGNSAPEVATAGAAVPDAPPANKSAAQRRNGYAFLITIVLAPAALLIIVSLMIFGTMTRRKLALPHPSAPYRGMVRVVYEEEADQAEPDADALAVACRELMKQLAGELVKAMSAVNSLKGVPALQTALHAELESIRRSLGFTPQIRGTPGEKKDWKQIKSQLVLSLQATERIIGIAEAARTSFSVHPAAREVVTTRLEACAFLGVNASASETVLKKAVNALRECWHPDLATDEEDRRLREIRIKQINVAWDLISGKQMSY